MCIRDRPFHDRLPRRAATVAGLEPGTISAHYSYRMFGGEMNGFFGGVHFFGPGRDQRRLSATGNPRASVICTAARLSILLRIFAATFSRITLNTRMAVA